MMKEDESRTFGSEQMKSLPLPRIMERLDALTGRKDYGAAARLLNYWKEEASFIGDLRGEFVILNEMMGVYRKMQNREKAIESAEKALAMIGSEEPAGSIGAGTAYVNAGTVYDCFEEPEKAVSCFESALGIYEASLSADDTRLAGLYNNMAAALTDMARCGEALHYCHKALEIMEKHPGGEPERAMTYLNMADAARTASGAEAAEEEIYGYLEEAEKLLRDPSVKRDGYYAFVCEKCAPAFFYYGWFQTGAELEKEAERIRLSLQKGDYKNEGS